MGILKCSFGLQIIMVFCASSFAVLMNQDAKLSLEISQDEPCDENCTSLVEELLFYIERGKQELQLCNETEFTMFVGLTKTGKSTLVQFLGNSSNKLISVCDGSGDCLIQDDSGSIGEGIASETFLPNLVMDKDTNNLTTALFDMPGFNDNRPRSIEIANALFFQMVLEHSKSIRIIILTSDASLEVGDGVSFPLLITNLGNLIKDPKKFNGGISLVVNRANYYRTPEQLYYKYVTYLREFFDLIDTTEVGNKENAKSIIQQLLVTETDSPNATDATNIAYMRSAEICGSVRDDEKFIQDYARLKQVVYDTTKPIAKVIEDFGIAISSDAIVVLDEATRQINAKITNQITNIAAKVVLDLNTNLLEIAKENYEYINETSDRLKNLINSNYPNPENDNIEPLNYIKELILNLKGFTNTKDEEDLILLESSGKELSLLYNIRKTPNNLNQKEWVRILVEIKELVLKEFSDQALAKISENLFSSLTELTMNLMQLILGDVKLPSNVDDQENAAKSYKTKIDSAVTKTSEHLKIPNGNLSDFILFTMEQFETIYPNLTNSPEIIENYLDFVPAIKVAEILGNFSWQSGYNWIQPIQELQIFVSLESDWIRFLRSLFDELETTTVQIEMNNKAHIFRENSPTTTPENFKTHWDLLSKIPIKAIINSDQEKIHSYIDLNPSALNAFNVVLDFTLSPKLECPTSMGDVATFEGNFIPISFVYSCLQGFSTIPSKVVILAHHKIFFDLDFDYSKLLTRLPIQLFVMSPNWFVSANSKFELSGLTGLDPNPIKLEGTNGQNGTEGNQGTLGSEIIGLYKTWSSMPLTTTTGGKGGVGQGGANGGNGESGSKRLLDVEGNDWVLESQCAAWSESDASKGNIQVKLYPNSCNEPGSRCHAGSDGEWVTIFGSAAQPGLPGGSGGEGGKGGIPGIAVYLDVSTTIPFENPGVIGMNGPQGTNGERGAQGSPGSDNKVRIDDEQKDGGNKRCRIKEGNTQIKSIQTVSKFPSNISLILDPIPLKKIIKANLKIRPKKFDFSIFQTYIKNFLAIAEYRLNQFNYKILTEFVTEVNSNPLLK